MSDSSASRRADTSLPVSERSWPCSVSSRVWNAHLLHSAHPGGEERRAPRSRRARTRSGFCVRWTRDHRPLHRHACGGGCNRGHELPGVSSQLGTQERGDVLVAVVRQINLSPFTRAAGLSLYHCGDNFITRLIFNLSETPGRLDGFPQLSIHPNRPGIALPAAFPQV